MGKSTASAPTPDPQIGEAAKMQAQTGQDWLNFAKDAFQVSTERQANLDALTKKIVDQQYGIAQKQADWASQDRQRYEDTFQPVEDQFVQEATNYDTQARRDEAAATARAEVQKNADLQKQAAERSAMAYGIKPGSGRFTGIDRAGALDTAAAQANAENTARQQVRDKGLALKADVANLGRGLPAQSAHALHAAHHHRRSDERGDGDGEPHSNHTPGLVLPGGTG